MPNDRAAVAREVLTEAAEAMRHHGWSESLRLDLEGLRDFLYPAPPAPETVTVGAVNTLRTGTANTLAVTVNLGTEILYLRDDELWIDGSCAIVAFPESRMSCALSRIASDARALAELRDENAQLKREVDWITERASSARIAANTFERERDRATADRDAGLRVLAEREARIAELEKASADYLRELNAFNTRVTELQSERDAALRAQHELESSVQCALSQFGVEFMDPPDGGDVSLAEQMLRMATALAEARAALRALEAKKGTALGQRDPNSEGGATLTKGNASPAPIPLGATRRWWLVIDSDGNVSVANSLTTAREWAETWTVADKIEYSVVPVIESVATRETVERVALDAWRDVGKVELRHVRQIVAYTYRAAGFTLEGA